MKKLKKILILPFRFIVWCFVSFFTIKETEERHTTDW